ncbi:MAG: hypothetical protein WA989_09250 [Henriciella sp.]|uniref:hypothetical protein n=1 Tax=Henriciella sp. TaxID=1968823 RepID=UPI003C723A17
MRLIIFYFAAIAALYIAIPAALGSAAAEKQDAPSEAVEVPTATASETASDPTNERPVEADAVPLSIELLAA